MFNGIRVLSVEVRNLKNMKYGKVEFDSLKQIESLNFDFDSSDIIGVYGPNGSSKTALINAIKILKKIFSLEKFNDDLSNYISFDEENMNITIKFFYRKNDYKAIYEYSVNFKRIGNDAIISSELLTKKEFNETTNKFDSKKISFDIDFEDNNIKTFLKTQSIYSRLTCNDNNVVGRLLTLKGMAFERKSSLIFSKEFYELLIKSDNFKEEVSFIHSLVNFGIHFMHVYDNKEISDIFVNDMMPFFYTKEEGKDNFETTTGYLSLFNEGYMTYDQEKAVNEYAELINGVLSKIVPGMKIGIINLGTSLNEKGEEVIKYSFVSYKKNFKIPLKYESDGIKKIISLLSSFISAFNHEDSFLAVDELDSGIFEFLLGTLVSIFKEDGKGQFIFTSHNLRALEVIKQDIIFTTQDENDRFDKMTGVNVTNNLRNLYIKENYYNNDKFSSNIDSNLIANALIKTRIKRHG